MPPTSAPTYVSELPAPDVEPHHPRSFAIGLTTLKEHGFGAFIRLRAKVFALDLAYGFMPVFCLVQDTSGTALDLKADMSTIHTSASAVFFFGSDQRRFQNGLRFSAIYDNIMGPAGSIGWVGDIVWSSFALGLGAGLQIYPDFASRAGEHFGISKHSLEQGLNEVQPYFGLSLFWYAG